MMEDPKEKCPDCGNCIVRLVSSGGAVIVKGKSPNNYPEVLKAKYWRDKNGVRHAVTSGDGHSKAPTVTKQTVTPEEAQSRTKAAREFNKKQRSKRSYRNYVRNVLKNKVQ